MTEKVEKIPSKAKIKGLSREELLNMDKNDLVDKIKQLEAHNLQLRNIISKSLDDKNGNGTYLNQKKYDFTKCHYRRILLRILYFGWDYQGLAVQEDSTKTIEHHLFHALIKSCLIEAREKSEYHRCGRTDKGVSAFGQVISITVRSKHPVLEQNLQSSLASEIQYCKILNRLLPKEIRAVCWMPIPDDRPEFSARFDCKKRKYKYYFPKSSLDIEAMRAACVPLVGSHDFRHLCKMDVGNGVTEFIRRISNVEILPVDEKHCDEPTTMYVLVIEGNAFLWHQIRCIMGILLLVGQGLESPSIVGELLDIERNPRKPQYNIASDTPLNLFECSFGVENNWVYDREELKTVIRHIQNEWTMYSVKATMIKDCLRSLEGVYRERERETEDRPQDESEGDSIASHTDCLLQGVQSKTYKPLLKRDTCSSLEERIEYYTKKRKLEKK